jgi:hypothetical protein
MNMLYPLFLKKMNEEGKYSQKYYMPAMTKN